MPDAPLQDFSCDESESELDTTMETVVMKTFSVDVETQSYSEVTTLPFFPEAFRDLTHLPGNLPLHNFFRESSVL